MSNTVEMLASQRCKSETYTLYMDLAAMLAAILTTALDPKNIFRFVEFEKQSCFDKILIDLFTKLWLFVTVWC